MDLSKSKVQERYTLSKTISARGWSWDTQLQTSAIIRDCALPENHQTREKTAEKLRLLLESVNTEEEAQQILTQFRSDLGLPPADSSNS